MNLIFIFHLLVFFYIFPCFIIFLILFLHFKYIRCILAPGPCLCDLPFSNLMVGNMQCLHIFFNCLNFLFIFFFYLAQNDEAVTLTAILFSSLLILHVTVTCKCTCMQHYLKVWSIWQWIKYGYCLCVCIYILRVHCDICLRISTQ